MALFQNSVLQEYLKLQNNEVVEKSYRKFTKYFHDRKIQVNIRNSKEEQFQEGFLRELFVKVFGYTLNPEPNFNLTTEQKNEKNAKKADGAIISRGLNPLDEGKIIAVIELKGTNTKDLGKIQEQAFGYKANQTGCVYVITSNFEKVRFYINNAVEFLEFNLFTLNKEQFKLMYLCLHKENLLNNIPLKINNASLVEEEKITKTFYADYSLFKRELYRDLVKQNVKNEVFRSELELEDQERGTKNIKLNLFKKSQKLIDRFLFIFFAEDRGLLTSNSTLKILEHWDKLKDLDAYQPLYNIYKLYFNYLDTGRKGTDKKSEIFAYNGGLFKPDTVLDSLLIDDDLLFKHTKKLSEYDFDSQVDVNILGHIFENSLNEIESVNAEIEGGEFDKQKTKRKKDGVFYTPKYITKYIVDNTIGTLCKEKRAEFEIVEEDYIQSKQKKTKEKLLENLKAYREWLLQITICDPACGSGAFLNQALDFLIKEHGNIDELETSLLGGAFIFPNIENTVLENNIFGVDLNEESVEIAKLSLWLRTAQPRRKLNNLNSNIKCGNSLIDDKKVAGNKAFNWQEEFPTVFKVKDNQAFHIVLTTHNSRTSARMIKNNIIKGAARELNLEQEIVLTEIIGDIIKEKDYNCIAYNICKDHLHLIIVCEYNELATIVKTIKGKSSFLFNSSNGFQPIDKSNNNSNGLKPIGGNNELNSFGENNELEPIGGNNTDIGKKKNEPLWSQKFFFANLNNWEVHTVSKKPSIIYDNAYIDNAIPYIQTNREKHDLAFSKKLNAIIKSFVKSEDDAFKNQFSGGFDVVIGNPPYVQIRDSYDFYIKEYKTFKSGDLYALFYEKSMDLINLNGVLGFITPSSFMTNIGYISLRLYLLEFDLRILVDLGANVFKDVSVDSAILVIKKSKSIYNQILKGTNLEKLSLINQTIFRNLDNSIFNIYTNPIALNLAEKLMSKNSTFNEYIKFSRGVEFGFKSDFVYPKKENENYVPILCGGNISKHKIVFENKFILHDTENSKIFKAKSIYENEKILIKRIGNSIIGSYDCNSYYNVCDVYNLQLKENSNYKLISISGIINSKLINFYYDTKFKSVKKLFPKIPIQNLKLLPLPRYIESIDSVLFETVNCRLILSNNEVSKTSSFQTYLKQKFSIKKLTKKLQNWHELEFGEFIKELNKAIKVVNKEGAKLQGVSTPCNKEEENKQVVKTTWVAIPTLTKLQEMDWLEVFETKKAEAQKIKAEIDKTDKEIDQMVYELYGLSEEEIAIVENS